MDKVEAREVLLAFRTSSYPNMDKKGRDRDYEKFKRLSELEEPAELDSFDLAKALGLVNE